MKLSEAIEGFELDWASSGKSFETIRVYKLHLQNLINYLDNPIIDQINSDDVRNFMKYLRTEHTPNRLSGDTSPYSDAAIANHWKAIRSLFRFCESAFGMDSPAADIPQIKFQTPEIVPFTKGEVRLLAKHSGKLSVKGKSHHFWRNMNNGRRNRAIVLLLLDTGIRVSELCRLKVEDIHEGAGEIEIRPCGSGQKTNPRIIPICRRSLKSVNRYLNEIDASPPDNLFGLTPSGVRTMLYNLGKRAEVLDVHPHRFRHTFAIMFLRNGGDVFTLQRFLGHQTLDMCKRYLHIANKDLHSVHRKASPVKKLDL